MPQTARKLAGPVAQQRSVLEAEVAALEARVAELEREKADLAGFAVVAAHELLAPLIMTEAYASMVSDRLDDGGDAASRRDLALLGRYAARVRLLVETLLDDACPIERLPRHRRVDLSSVARECLRSLAPEIRASGARVRVAQLPDAIGDRRLISVVLTTLIATALRSGRRARCSS